MSEPTASPVSVWPPDFESVRRARRWLGTRRYLHPEVPVTLLVQEATRHFDLEPLEQQELLARLEDGDR